MYVTLRHVSLAMILASTTAEFSLKQVVGTHFRVLRCLTNDYIRRCNVCNARVPFGHKIILLCSDDWEGGYTYQLSPSWETIENKIQPSIHKRLLISDQLLFINDHRK
ncbi:hypothetical protein V1519DRAFT_452897 [Lipomyces tetrasporus]